MRNLRMYAKCIATAFAPYREVCDRVQFTSDSAFESVAGSIQPILFCLENAALIKFPEKKMLYVNFFKLVHQVCIVACTVTLNYK